MSSIHSILSAKCPKCEKGMIFEQKGNIFLLRVPKMHEKCPECNYVNEKEPGYFLGAMYVSYGLAILELFVVFFASYWLVPLWLFFVIVFTTLVLFSFFNFRWSRILWIHLFPY